MDKPIPGDKYIRTLSHYLRTNQRRLLPAPIDNNGSAYDTASNSDSHSVHSRKNAGSPLSRGTRHLITPTDPMAAAYEGMVNSLWTVGSVVVNSIPLVGGRSTASDEHHPPLASAAAQDRDAFHGAWDGTGSVSADASPRERQLYLQAQLKAPIFPLDLYYFLYLLDRFEEMGIDIEGWNGSDPRVTGDSKPRILSGAAGGAAGVGGAAATGYSSFPPPDSNRPGSIRSFSSHALSTLTLITGWKQWSSAAATNSEEQTILDDIQFVHKFLQRIPGLRLVAKMPPGQDIPGKGRIEGFGASAIVALMNIGQIESHPGAPLAIRLPVMTTFSALTHLELHKIPPKAVDGWDQLMRQLKSLVVVQAGIEDVYDVIVTAVVESERRRRQRAFKERNRAVLIRQEQREALKDASQITASKRQGHPHQHHHSVHGRRQGSSGSSSSVEAFGSGSGSGSVSPSSSTTSQPSSPSYSLGTAKDEAEADDEQILKSLRMWPKLRHFSVSDNSLPALNHANSFSYAEAIVSLDLSHNLLNALPPGLIQLHNLQHLNLSYNMISTVQQVYQVLGNISVLDLRGNRLESLCGLERLWNLEKVDVRDNHLGEAAEVGRLAALPGIREIWSEKNPFCTLQATNGHDLLLDGMFASFVEKRALATLSPSAFSTTISSINNVNVAHIPADSVPAAVLSKDLAATRPTPTSPPQKLSKNHQSTVIGNSCTVGHSTTNGRENPNKMEGIGSVLGPPVEIEESKKAPTKTVTKKKSAAKKKAAATEDSKAKTEADSENIVKKKKKSTKKSAGATGKKSKKSAEKEEQGSRPMSPEGVSFVDGHSSGGESDGDKAQHHHVHRLSQLEEEMAALEVEASSHHHHHHHGHSHPHGKAPKGILKKRSSFVPESAHESSGSGGRRSESPFSHMEEDSHYSSDGGESTVAGGAEEYRRKIEAMRNEAGSNWLKVLAEMDSEQRPKSRT
ncbi:hypothetical protein BGW38_006001 [Lunasporangiospora selenospora]|uniref:Leucine rich repeat-containing protein n=1 Tax=Lunasporangiospora selenospora TaxID=979761 RepID=A0A9P6G0G9_9FUNG|nr:hypothetical protein BGW38_006001 [Lunasporangiospora selenospora]